MCLGLFSADLFTSFTDFLPGAAAPDSSDGIDEAFG